MQLSRLRPVYDNQGPFVTVYLESRSPAEDAPTQTRLRWQDLRKILVDDGAEAVALDAVESALVGEKAGELQADGRVLVATTAGVALDTPWDAALGTGDMAHWTAAPELGAYVREEARSVRLLVAIAEQQGAVIRQEVATSEHATDETSSTVKKATPHGTHKPRAQGLSHDRIQRRVDQSMQYDARTIVEHLNQIAPEFDPDLLVLAGEVQARTEIRDQLPADLAELCVEAERGGTDDDAAEEALAAELRQIASEHSERRTTAQNDQFQSAKAHGLAREGRNAVAQAGERGAVDTLLFDYDIPVAGEAELLRTCAATDAHVDLADTDMAEAVGAVLRFELPSAAQAQAEEAAAAEET
jgi:hypothetical protein